MCISLSEGTFIPAHPDASRTNTSSNILILCGGAGGEAFYKLPHYGMTVFTCFLYQGQCSGISVQIVPCNCYMSKTPHHTQLWCSLYGKTGGLRFADSFSSRSLTGCTSFLHQNFVKITSNSRAIN